MAPFIFLGILTCNNRRYVMTKIIKYNRAGFQNTSNMIKRNRLLTHIQRLLTDPDHEVFDSETDEPTGEIVIFLDAKSVKELNDSIKAVKKQDLITAKEISNALNPHLYDKPSVVNDN